MRRADRICALGFLAMLLPVLAVCQPQPCRQALALGLDVSGSVDALEYRLQIEGLAYALNTDRVRRSLLSAPQSPVDILIYEWSGTGDQHILVDWTTVSGDADIARIQDTLTNATRRATSPGTAIGEALDFGLVQLNRRTYCQKRTLDISGDGKSNLGPDPSARRTALGNAGVTVNALVVGADVSTIGDTGQTQIGELSSYFRSRVIIGPDAFVQTALGYQEYAQAMARKLERELEFLVVSNLGRESLR